MNTKKDRRLNQDEAKLLGLQVKPNEKGRKTARYYLSDETFDLIKHLRISPNDREFVETQIKKNKNGEVVSTIEKFQSEPLDVPEDFEIIKISTSRTTGQQWIQYTKKKPDDLKEIDFVSIIEKHIKPVKVKKIVTDNTPDDFQSLTYSDVHIGMDTDKYKNSMYAVEWNREEVLKSAHYMVEKVLKNITSKILVIDELGDLLDGFNAKTTRGGHDLPQNMTNEEVYDCALELKMILLDNLIPYFDKIIFNNICNDNHAGSFGYFVNSAFKQIADLKYQNIEVNNHRKFMNHYFIGNIAFIITHGKDDKALKFGFKPQLDTKSIEKIDQYCKHNNIYKNSDLVIFKKGDSHQALFDMCGSDDFYYFNYPAVSPSSQWVQTNFKKGRKGFVLESFKGLKNTMIPFFS